MPMYEYRCPHCKARFELLQRMGQGAQGVRCPQCGQSEVERQLSTFAGQSSAATGFAAAGCGSGGSSGFT